MNILFIGNSIALGVGLAMDAFCVSMTNGMNDPKMKRGKMLGIAGMYALFQFGMPMIGWFCVHTIVAWFRAFQKFVPWIALLLLLYIGVGLLLEGIRNREEASEEYRLTIRELLIQAVATSIDALSVGVAISHYGAPMAFAAALIIAAVTMTVCVAGVNIGRKFGTILAGKANILGGIILIGIGIEIFIKGVFL
jgi:putative Mn2+ efflux pump MntP